MSFVLDCSITMSWLFEDESSSYADAVRDLLIESECLAPAIWLLEVINALLVAQRRRRLSKSDALKFLEFLFTLPIRVVEIDGRQTAFSIHQVAHDHQLSAYDAAYLEIARQESVPLATMDGPLAKAAQRASIPLLKPG